MYNENQVYKPSFALVIGYLKGIDKMPQIAKRHELFNRFSLAFDSYNPLRGEIYFDTSMFEALFKTLFDQIKYDRIEIEYNSTSKGIFDSFSDAIELIKKNYAVNDTCFDRIFVYQLGQLVFYIQTEYYTSVGGPHPYHDTFNFACFVSKLDRDSIEATIDQTCKLNQYNIRAIEVGSPEVKSASIWEHLKNMFSYV